MARFIGGAWHGRIVRNDQKDDLVLLPEDAALVKAGLMCTLVGYLWGTWTRGDGRRFEVWCWSRLKEAQIHELCAAMYQR